METKNLSVFTLEQLAEFAYNTIKTAKSSLTSLSIVRGPEPSHGVAPGWLVTINFAQQDGTLIHISRKDLDLRKALESAVNKLLTLK